MKIIFHGVKNNFHRKSQLNYESKISYKKTNKLNREISVQGNENYNLRQTNYNFHTKEFE